MSDDHEALAREQEQEASDLEQRSDDLQEDIEAAKKDAAGLEASETIATPDPAIEGGEEPDPDANQPPPETRFTGKDTADDERTDQGV